MTGRGFITAREIALARLIAPHLALGHKPEALALQSGKATSNEKVHTPERHQGARR
jgi:hypothetical protein